MAAGLRYITELPAQPSSTTVEVRMFQVEAPVDMEVEPGAVEDAEMPSLDFEGDDQMLERVALTQQEEKYLATGRCNRMTHNSFRDARLPVRRAP